MRPMARTRRLVLRPFEDRDLEAFVAYRADPEVARWQSWSDYTRAQGEAFLAWTKTATLGEGWYQIALEHGGQLVGDIAVNGQSPTEVELGVTLSRGAWGQGLASEAFRTLLPFLEARGVRRFEAITDARNVGAQRLFAALGFEVADVVHTEFKGSPCEEWVYRREI